MTPLELARKVKALQLTTRHLVTEVFAGEYSSAFKGRGIEFADVREYQPGDDVRTIDWNVTARACRPFVKRFNEERELTILLCVDVSASGDFGTGSHDKRELAAELAAVIAFAATKKNDRVGLLLFSDHVERFVPPAKGTRHVLRMIRDLLAFEPTGRGTSIRTAADHAARLLHRRSVVMVISDFLDEDPAGALQVLSRRHDVVAMHISDPREGELPPVGLVDAVDPETGRRVLLDTSNRRVREFYAADAGQRRERLARDLARLGADAVAISTDRAYIHDLIEFFRKRELRR
jgi:uncharacterized protein (DUF58 family)